MHACVYVREREGVCERYTGDKKKVSVEKKKEDIKRE